MKIILIVGILILGILLLVALGDVLQLDNTLYQNLHIQPLNYYDLRLWDFYQAIGAIGALLFGITAACIAYSTWNLEHIPMVHAAGTLLISTSNDTNDDRNRLLGRYNTWQLVNVGRGPARNVTLSVSRNKKGFLLEDFCADTIPIAGNSRTGEMNLDLRVYGQRFVTNEYKLEGNENEKFFYIHYEDHTRNEHVTKVKISKVKQAEGDLRVVTVKPSLQVWKVMKNEDLK